MRRHGVDLGKTASSHKLGSNAMNESARTQLRDRAARGQLDEATLTLAEEALARDPTNAFARIVCSRCLEAAGRLHEAVSQLDAVLQRDADDSVARNRRASLLKQLAARERAQRILADEGSVGLLAAANDAKAAEREIDFQVEARRLLVAEGETIKALCALGAALRVRRDYGAALLAYTEARELDESPQSNSMTWVGLAGVLRDLRRLREAEHLAREVLTVEPRDAHARAVLAAICMDDYEQHHDPARLDESEALIRPLQGDIYFSLQGRLAALRRTMHA
jgi:tetratricopeptide (TPR) repeat protein